MVDIVIDAELEAYLPPIKEKTASELEQELLAFGSARDPLVVWKGTGILVDGHRRYAICTRHNLPFKVEEMEFASRDKVKLWMIRNQMARRNMTEHQRKMVLAKEAGEVKKDSKRGDGRIAATVAANAGVPERTVERAISHSKAVEQVIPAIREAANAGTIKLPNKVAKELAAMPPAEQENVWAQVNDGTFKTLRDAIFGEEVTPASKPEPVADDFLDAPTPVVRQQVHDDFLDGPAAVEESKPKPSKPRTPKSAGSPAAQKGKINPKSAADLSYEASWRLGALKQAMDEFNAAFPSKQHKEIMGVLRTVSQRVAIWTSEVV